jgi:hypothetical protein
MTCAGRAALLLMVAWLAAVAMLTARGALVSYLAAALPGSAVALVLRSLVRQQRAPSMLDPRHRLPDRYWVADDLTQPITAVIKAAEA